MKWAVLAIAAACDANAPPFQYALLSYEAEFSDKACACHDPACAQRVGDEHATFDRVHADDTRGMQLSPEESAKLAQLRAKDQQCLRDATITKAP